MKEFLYRNSLTLVLLGFFAASVAGHALTGWRSLLQELELYNLPAVSFPSYLGSGHFISALFENWESEFLQMACYVLLTIFLRQKGSPESKPLEGESEEDADARKGSASSTAPWPTRGNAAVRWLYANSLSLALLGLFLLSFAFHLVGSSMRTNDEGARYGKPPMSMAEHLSEAEFWFESFQNWQSEFLAIGVFIVLGIYLRQRGFPESKPVAAPHDHTGR
jgi:hypothetical protein